MAAADPARSDDGGSRQPGGVDGRGRAGDLQPGAGLAVPGRRRRGDGTTPPGVAAVRRKYGRLLELLQVRVCADVFTGTSAGGINAACLGLAEAFGASVDNLRNTWLFASGGGPTPTSPRTRRSTKKTTAPVMAPNPARPESALVRRPTVDMHPTGSVVQ